MPLHVGGVPDAKLSEGREAAGLNPCVPPLCRAAAYDAMGRYEAAVADYRKALDFA